MKHFFTLIVLLVSLSSYANFDPTSEKEGSISGTVIDKKLQEPIPYVTVVIQTLTGDVVTGGITDENGSFSIKDIPLGKNKVVIQYIGYKSYSSEIDLSRKNKKLKLGNISLEEDVAQLDEVVVTAETTTIQQKIDRKVITIGKDLSTAGATASDIMINLPSVSVDQQTGDVSLRGNQNVKVMVDGKLSNVPVAQLLKQIPSTSIKQIELITNPSAKYNPEGMSGIINIILHKNVKLGFNGNINTGLTYDENARFTGSTDLNYRNGKFNFFGNYGYNVSKNQNRGYINRTAEDIEQFFSFLDDNQSHLAKIGLDFYLNDKNTLSFFTNQNWNEGNTLGNTILQYNLNPEFNQTQGFSQEGESLASQYNFNYKLDFDKDGHNIELEADYNTYEDDDMQMFDSTGASTIPAYDDFVSTDRDRTTINLDYVNPLSDTEKLEIGAEARLFETNIGYNSTGLTFNADGILVPTGDTDFDYNRDIYSGYVTYGKKYDKWSYQVGARVESVDVKADTNTVRSFENDYFQVYPSAYITYTPTEKNNYQVSYSRRVDRPGLGQVNPIREWSTPLISSYGNTDLQPQFTNSVEANYTRNLEKGSITAGVFYRSIEDEISRVLFIDRVDLSKVILSFDNFDNTSAYGVELSSNYRPTKWWNFNASFDLYNQTQRGFAESIDLNIENPTIADISIDKKEVDNVTYSFRMFNNFKVTKKLSLSAFGFYRGKNENLQFKVDPMYFVNIGARYKLWDGKGTFSINYNDIFDTMKFAFEGTSPYPSTGEFNWESNSINVNLSYRFGGGKYRAKSRKRRDNDEKSGGGGIF